MQSKVDAVWEQLLCVKRRVLPQHCQVGINGQDHCISEQSLSEKAPQASTTWQAIISRQRDDIAGFDQISLLNGRAFLYLHQDLSNHIRQMYRLYLPLACARMIKPDAPFVMVHVAQSLDGKVCTLNGASKWIGNDENLIHAHRIRALVDGVAVGGNTLRTEQPALTVRHVTGDNPTRLIFSNCAESLANMPKYPGTRTIVICHDGKIAAINAALRHRTDIQLLAYPNTLTDEQSFKTGHNQAARQTLLKKLQQFDIHSAMVEGGPGLISWLIKARLVDTLQVHIAPLLFGSGKSLAELGAIADVSQAIHLQSPYYCAMGDAMMMTAELTAAELERSH